MPELVPRADQERCTDDVALLLCARIRVHRARGDPNVWAYFCRRLVDAGHPHLRDDCEHSAEHCDSGAWSLFSVPHADASDLFAQYATTPFKGVERNDTFHNILNLPVHFRDTPKVSQ